MSRIVGVIFTVCALSLGLVPAGCGSFDPTSIFDSDFFSTKKRLPGERQPVFPEGTPGVSQGVPAEMVKGYQPPPEPDPAQVAAEKAKPKPKPKPKVVAQPKEESKPTAVMVRPSSQSQSQASWPDPPPPR
jgi:hypothetical protein